MATLGCTSSAARKRPAGVAGVVDADAADTCAGAPGMEAAVEIARLDRRSPAGREHEAEILPDRSGYFPGLVLFLVAEVERGQADIRQRQNGGRSLGLGL